MEREYGVWCITKPGWCCMQGGDPATDDPWKGTKARADEVFDLVSKLNPGHRYEIRPYERKVLS
jgi:hypothetical protein